MASATDVSLKNGLVTGVDIIAYLTKDPSRSIAFYRDVLGMTPTEVEDRGAEFELGDGTTFGVWQPDDVEGSVPGATVMFAVADIAAAVAEFRKRGAQISDPSETGVCFMAFGADPDGNPFIVHQRKTKG